MDSGNTYFQCQNCGQMNDAHAASLVGACTACGLTFQEGNHKMQDDLTKMFNRNMTFSSPQIGSISNPPSDQIATYRISQHYHHSGHASNDSESSREEQMSFQDVLRHNNIDPLHLLSSQLILFEHANADQRSRLIELWSITPPSQSRLDGLGGWSTTSMEEETELAKLRYERIQASEQDKGMYDVSMDSNQSEPYIESGYQALAAQGHRSSTQAPKESFSPLGSAVGNSHRPATDPAFQSKEWWRGFMVEQPIEYQYGRFDQLNQFRADEEML